VTDMDCENIKDALAELIVRVDQIYKVIEGNGHIGLKEQAIQNTAHRIRMEKLIDGLWLKVVMIWFTTIGTIAALIKVLGN
jgi:hypothetical protein